ncbi:MarR family winged helix-turn-helix transcriptional regulator [Mycobacteroides abscessus]|uniref:MarR family winged helix-turn-helix transcriptional regulator n=1 Tax=Mycobacteroides abscessus TaxID=36809 RepID=UPI00092A15AD|nr:MarR family transcriptional regulator [Mycobacteroides abscessus]PVA34880.1 MarR family transcriptional regulator [Mycobacteroides abscessus]PVA53348.1 MarR family transcriptional regulator [Mycobacteroides abscessus]RIQ94266.1 MarR family transcriptional regulator [Mycobacteroides abscessus]RIQ95828.1 MarR family transcriptional regulator [Mycobacteroides abscessus]RIS07341.1 MarR family transcriptional regulator [Mycobacteroides abscessus]
MAQQNLDGRPDIAALLVPLGRSFIRAELPLLEAHGVSMWAYAVLTALRDNEASSQASLADAIGADRTRIIAVLDDLQERKLINRQPDPSDRRSNLLSLTPAGRKTVTAVQKAIQDNENRILAGVSSADRGAFLRVLEYLAHLDDSQFSPRN